MTTKALRTPPPRKLNDYVASIRKFSNGEFFKYYPDANFSSSQFLTNGAVTSDGSNISSTILSNYNKNIALGFEVTINGFTYTEIAIAQCGWAALVKPGSTAPLIGAPYLLTSASDNTTINSISAEEHVLLAPWFDQLYPIANAPSVLYADATYNSASDFTSTIRDNILAGKDTRNWPINAIDRGTRYARFHDGNKGLCFLVRWTGAPSYFNRRIKFEACVYESGRIEYRYWPHESLFNLGSSSFTGGDTNVTATCGIFWSGILTGGTNKFRDFAPLLNYDNGTTRTISSLGGASYSASYTDNSKPYVNRLKIVNNWPKNGAIISFTPPVKHAKFLPKKISIAAAATKEIVRSPGGFDDRKTVSLHSGSTTMTVHMPSTMPSRLLGDTSSEINVPLQQLLFTSGSIVMYGSPKNSSIDSLRSQLEAVDSLARNIDFSFNEAQKSYQTTTVTSSYYATGSSLELFGDGFTAPLKSKTQFTLSVPVQNPVTMPSDAASIYYYNFSKKTWEMAGETRGIESFVGLKTADSWWVDRGPGTVEPPIYRVVETSRGFDAVGRKISSGSSGYNLTANTNINNATNSSRQSHPSIGAVFNIDRSSYPFAQGTYYSTDQLVSEVEDLQDQDAAITKEYSNSITDASNYQPNKSQIIGDFNIDYPFLVEKLTVDIPLYISGNWFNDVTTCSRAIAVLTGSRTGNIFGKPVGPIDFGGPGITVALMCARRGENFSYLDLIASGTITHVNDDYAGVLLRKASNADYYSMQPMGFRSFSNPSSIISGDGSNVFEGSVRLEMAASIAGGITLARNDRSHIYEISSDFVNSNKEKAKELLRKKVIPTSGEGKFNFFHSEQLDGDLDPYKSRTPFVYVQQISPLSRGTSKFEFNGNSILGGNIASFNLESEVNNPLYVNDADKLSEYESMIDGDSNFAFDAVSIYSTVDSRPAPYLIMPGDKLTLSISKTRPVLYSATETGHWPWYVENPNEIINPGDPLESYRFESFALTGSHGTVKLNTGNINITLYGSYVKEGAEYHP